MKQVKPNPSLVRRNPAQEREIVQKYGITEDQYQQILQLQGGVCAICGNHQRKQRLSIDHCHLTKKVRGLLCTRCNRALGKFYDSAVRLRRAADYLENHETRLAEILK